jgi:hypothetical protein
VPMMPLPDVVDVMLADLKLGLLPVKPLLTCAWRFNVCRRLSLVVDLGRPGDGLAKVSRADASLGGVDAPGVDSLA